MGGGVVKSKNEGSEGNLIGKNHQDGPRPLGLLEDNGGV